MQIQLAATVYSLTEMQRTLAEVQAAADGLEEAIESLEAIAQHPATPYPKHDIEQRANMARNTMRKQLERSIQAQKEYEEKNAEKLLASKQAREIELKKREDAYIHALVTTHHRSVVNRPYGIRGIAAVTAIKELKGHDRRLLGNAGNT